MKWSVTAVCMLFLLIATPPGNAQSGEPLLEDDAGDVMLSLYDNSNPMPGGWDAVDLLSLDMVETPDTIIVTLGMNGFPDCQEGTCPNAGDTRIHFDYGDSRYAIQTGTSGTGFRYGFFHTVGEDDFQLTDRIDLGVTVDETAVTYTVDVPRDLIVDHVGSPPRRDTELTNIYARAYSQVSFGGPDPDRIQESGSRDMLTTSDTMGLDDPASFPITTGGVESNGPVTLTSAAPYRASNGGEGTFRFDLQAMQTGPGEPLFDLEFEGVPESWTVERPEGLLRLPSGVPAEFSILVTTPFGHQHGGSEPFNFRIIGHDDPDLWAAVELGIHYVSVPQPSGHHQTMWFHNQPFPEPGNTISNALGGSNGEVSMNTLETEEGLEEGPVQGWIGTLNQDDVYHWSVCMNPDLRMGIDMNMTQTGETRLLLESTRGMDDVTITGRVLHLGGGDPIGGCFSNQYSHRTATQIASIEETVVAHIGSSTEVVIPVTPAAAGDYVPYEKGALLVFEFEANPANLVPVTRNPGGPDALNLMPGGELTLPLNEYHDARPQGLIGWSDPDQESQEDADLEGDSFTPAAETQTAPTAPLAFVALVLLAAVIARRRS